MGLVPKTKIDLLRQKGVKIPCPQAVEIGEDVDVDRISGDEVIFHSGCKVYGRRTLILPGARLGYEGPVTIENCQLGAHVVLSGGFFKNAVFLNHARMGIGAHVRAGTIVEEHACCAHTVALKQSILFPYVTLGSLVNFCDAFISGGSGPKEHSEVGSAYIHFNFTPNQDKATASMMGDVPRGVMLDQPAIFLGGQGGLVGPCRIGFGNVIAAGVVYRKDELGTGYLLTSGQGRAARLPYKSGRFANPQRVWNNNAIYMANLTALLQWYQTVRARFVCPSFPDALLEALTQTLHAALDERLSRLNVYCQKVASTPTGAAAVSWIQRWEEIVERCGLHRSYGGDPSLRETLLNGIDRGIQEQGHAYLKVIHSLLPGERAAGTLWLQGIVDQITRVVFDVAPEGVVQEN